MLRPRRRPRFGGAHLCAGIAAILLLLSVSILHSRLGGAGKSQPQTFSSFRLGLGLGLSSETQKTPVSAIETQSDLADDEAIVDLLTDDFEREGDDRIDEFDNVEEENDAENESRAFDDDDDDIEVDEGKRNSGYFYDHVVGVTRRAFDKQSFDDDDGDERLRVDVGSKDDKSKTAFASDDQPLDEGVRLRLEEIKSIEDALLLKTRANSALRDGWAPWFEKKGDFLRRDRMFKSNLDVLNPLSNQLLQDPDMPGSTSLTRGDKLMRKGMLKAFGKLPFGGLKLDKTDGRKRTGNVGVGNERDEIKRVERKTLDDTARYQKSKVRSSVVSGSSRKGIGVANNHVTHVNMGTGEIKTVENGALGVSASDISVQKKTNVRNFEVSGLSRKRHSVGRDQEEGLSELSNHCRHGTVDTVKSLDLSCDAFQQGSSNSQAESKIKLERHVYADGRRWGNFPGLDSHLSFSNFMDQFFLHGKCSLRVFMVWNSPPWMYNVRHQRGLESVLYHHPDACIVVFSETIELDFFSDFVKDRFKVAVAMPNLDELLKDTPTHVFASLWHEWRKTQFYPVHYSELVRLAALYKYGGVYLDSDVIALKSLLSLKNSIAVVDQPAGVSSLNGAVMAFEKNSPFIMECLREYYSTYDDTRLRWNGAELLTRVYGRLSHSPLVHKIKPSFTVFPVDSQNITRYFTAAADEVEKAEQDALFRRILEKFPAFHFWNFLTSALVPEPGSLVERLLNHQCLRCLDVL